MTPSTRARTAGLLACSTLVLLLAGCGKSTDSASTTTTAKMTTTTAKATTTTAKATTTAAPSTTGASTTAKAMDSTTTTAAAMADDSITNTWSAGPVDTTKLPIGTSHVSTDSASKGGLWACQGANPRGGGAQVAGPWLDEAAGTWDLSKKVSVQGDVSWPMASYKETIEGSTRNIVSNGVPVGAITGTFPVAADDPAYNYDRNPNTISEQTVTMALPVAPEAASSPSCLGMGRIGVLKNGVSLFASVDELARDAVAYETQDKCDGHPQQTGVYHYHSIPSCVLNASKGASTVVGFATDGFPIVVERDADGNLPTNADLDECHGRTSKIMLDDKVVEMYHYSATYEFPYFIGCMHGTAAG